MEGISTKELPQIKIFKLGICKEDDAETERLINEYVVEAYNHSRYKPTIEHSGGYVFVICDKRVEVRNVAPAPTRIPPTKY